MRLFYSKGGSMAVCDQDQGTVEDESTSTRVE